MPQVNFYLKKPAKVTKRSLIFLCFKYSGKRLLYSFGQNIDPKNWNNRQRVKSGSITTEDGRFFLNDLLDNLEKVCLTAYYKELSTNGVPTTEQLKKELDTFINFNHNQQKQAQLIPTFFELVDTFINGTILYKGNQKSTGTLKSYQTTKNHLLAFEKAEKYDINYNTITLDFFYRWVSYMRSEGLNQNSLNKNVGVLKAIMAEAVDLGYTDNMQFRRKKFGIPQALSETIALREDELMKLYHCDLSGHKAIERVRDMFIFGAYTGLRWSDYSTMLPEHIQVMDGDLYVTKVTQKTKEPVIIPCNQIILEIFEKYKEYPNRLPPSISSVKFNVYIKDACRLAGLTETGKLTSDPSKSLANCVSSHTARRSYATNSYLAGIPIYDIMKMTGHKTDKAFLRYIRLSKWEVAKRVSGHMKQNVSKYALKAV